MTEKVQIVSTGSYLPAAVLGNDELSRRLGVEPDWITQRTGVQYRHVAAADESTSTMAVLAAKDAMQKSGLDISQIDLILLTTSISDTTLPPSACRVHRELGAEAIPALDISASCSGFIYGLATAKAYIQSGMVKTVLLCSSEIRSKFIDYTDRDTASVYGDGAGAIILRASDKSQDEEGIMDISLGADGSGAETITIPAGGTSLPTSEQTVKDGLHYVRFHDKTIIKSAVRGLKRHVQERLLHLNMDINDIDVFVPHQMNLRMIESLSKRMHVPIEKFVVNIQDVGNTSSASIPIAFDQARKAGRIKNGDLAMFLSYGAGFTWGIALYQF